MRHVTCATSPFRVMARPDRLPHHQRMRHARLAFAALALVAALTVPAAAGAMTAPHHTCHCAKR
jgi:hypothetical protein